MAFSVSFSPTWLLQAPLIGATGEPTSELNDNISVSVYPQWYDSVSLSWTVPSTWGNCKFHVYFWDGGQTGYSRLTTNPITTPFFKDPTTRDYSKFRNSYYVVEALLPSGQRVKSALTSWHYRRRDRVEKIAAEIQRREYILLRKLNGVKSFLFKRKTYGLRCHRCWNATQEKVMDDNCSVCLGTSFEGGYFDPLPLFVNYDPTPNEIIKGFVGRIESNMISGWTISVPEISADDVIIRSGDWNVYSVSKVQTTELQTNAVRQMMALSQLSKKDIENLLSDRVQDSDAAKYMEMIGGEFNAKRMPQAPLDTSQLNDPDWMQEQNFPSLPKYKI
jgi:hypothetical protein